MTSASVVRPQLGSLLADSVVASAGAEPLREWPAIAPAILYPTRLRLGRQKKIPSKTFSAEGTLAAALTPMQTSLAGGGGRAESDRRR